MENLTATFEALGEALKRKDTEIANLKWEVEYLKGKIKELEEKKDF